jgi:hypothetical protein
MRKYKVNKNIYTSMACLKVEINEFFVQTFICEISNMLSIKTNKNGMKQINSLKNTRKAFL